MKKFYDEPVIEVVVMDASDIVTASPLTEGNVVEIPFENL